MVWKFFEGLDLHEVYSVITNYFVIFTLFFICLFLIIHFKYDVKILRRLLIFFERNNKKIKIFFIFLIFFSIGGFIFMKFLCYDLDKSTSVIIDEKILIIEIDDYWNIKDTQDYFAKYGYTMKDYREVSDIIDKYGFVASLGVTPYIFVEEIRKNFALRNDSEMVEYLKELDDKGYELAMHGYSHCRNVNYCPKYEEVWYNVLDGKLELEDIFDQTLFTYLPPGNAWTTEQYNNVKKAGFLVIGNTHVPHAYFDENLIITNRCYDPIYIYDWYGLDFKHTSVDEWIESYEKTNLFTLQLHCNTFDSQEKLDDFDEFLEYVKKDGAKVMTYKDFYKYINDKKISEGKTGKVILNFN